MAVTTTPIPASTTDQNPIPSTTPVASTTPAPATNPPAWTAPVTSNNNAPTPAANPLGISAPIKKSYESTLLDTLSGAMYNPIRSGAQEALARSEANQRAKTAQQVAGAGMTGTGLENPLMQGTENGILQQRFTTNNQIDQGEAAARAAALPEARAYMGQQGDDAVKTFQLAQSMKSAAGSDLAAYMQNHLDYSDSVNADPNAVFNDPAAKNALQKYWESTGGQGEVPADWAAGQVKAITDKRLTDPVAQMQYQTDYWKKQGLITDQEQAALLHITTTGGTDATDAKYWTKDANGHYTFNSKLYNEDQKNGGIDPNAPAAGTTDVGVGNYDASNPPPNITSESYYTGKNGTIYQWDGSKGQEVDVTTLNWAKLSKNPELAKAAAASGDMPEQSFSNFKDFATTNNALTATEKSAPKVLNLPGGEQVVAKLIGGHNADGGYVAQYNGADGSKIAVWMTNGGYDVLKKDASGKITGTNIDGTPANYPEDAKASAYPYLNF